MCNINPNITNVKYNRLPSSPREAVGPTPPATPAPLFGPSPAAGRQIPPLPKPPSTPHPFYGVMFTPDGKHAPGGQYLMNGPKDTLVAIPAKDRSKNLRNAIMDMKAAKSLQEDLTLTHPGPRLAQALLCIFSDCRESHSWDTVANSPYLSQAILSYGDVMIDFVKEIHQDFRENTPLGKIIGKLNLENDDNGDRLAALQISENDLGIMLQKTRINYQEGPVRAFLGVLGGLGLQEEGGTLSMGKTPSKEIGLYKRPDEDQLEGGLFVADLVCTLQDPNQIEGLRTPPKAFELLMSNDNSKNIFIQMAANFSDKEKLQIFQQWNAITELC